MNKKTQKKLWDLSAKMLQNVEEFCELTKLQASEFVGGKYLKISSKAPVVAFRWSGDSSHIPLITNLLPRNVTVSIHRSGVLVLTDISPASTYIRKGDWHVGYSNCADRNSVPNKVFHELYSITGNAGNV